MKDVIFFFRNIFKDYQLTSVQIEKFSSFFTKRNYKNKTMIMSEQDLNNHIYFIYSGVLRSYLIDYDGCESTFRFATEGDFIKGNFANNAPSTTNIQCVGDCSLLVGDWNTILNYALSIPAYSLFINNQLAMGYTGIIKQLSNLIRLKAKDRYLYFIDNYPGLIDRIPHYMIANYLGMTPQQLSRIRQQLFNPK